MGFCKTPSCSLLTLCCTLLAKLFNLNFKLCLATAIHDMKWLENYWYLFNLKPNIYKKMMFKHTFIPNNSDI